MLVISIRFPLEMPKGRSPAANGEPGAPTLLGSRCAEHGGVIKAVVWSVPTAPGAVMVSPAATPRNRADKRRPRRTRVYSAAREKTWKGPQ